MKELKFKAWDIREKRMHVIDRLGLHGFSHDFYSRDAVVCDVRQNDKERYIILQFTGLNDKNGEEMYDGDIIKCTDGADEIDIYDSDTGLGVVEWNNEYSFWSISKIENGLGDILHKGYVEIVGNIYENPELLEAHQ